MSNPSFVHRSSSTTAVSSTTVTATRDFEPPSYAETVSVDDMEEDIGHLLCEVREVSIVKLQHDVVLIPVVGFRYHIEQVQHSNAIPSFRGRLD